jgi:hypothetical protein
MPPCLTHPPGASRAGICLQAVATAGSPAGGTCARHPRTCSLICIFLRHCCLLLHALVCGSSQLTCTAAATCLRRHWVSLVAAWSCAASALRGEGLGRVPSGGSRTDVTPGGQQSPCWGSVGVTASFKRGWAFWDLCFSLCAVCVGCVSRAVCAGGMTAGVGFLAGGSHTCMRQCCCVLATMHAGICTGWGPWGGWILLQHHTHCVEGPYSTPGSLSAGVHVTWPQAACLLGHAMGAVLGHAGSSVSQLLNGQGEGWTAGMGFDPTPSHLWLTVQQVGRIHAFVPSPAPDVAEPCVGGGHLWQGLVPAPLAWQQCLPAAAGVQLQSSERCHVRRHGQPSRVCGCCLVCICCSLVTPTHHIPWDSTLRCWFQVCSTHTHNRAW